MHGGDRIILPETIYSEYLPKILNYVRSRVNSQSDAEDLAEDIMLKALNKLDTFDRQRASLSTWMYTLAHNSVIDFYRARRRCSVELNENTATDDGDMLSDIISGEELESLASAIEQLNVRERDIIVMRYYDERDMQDIAREMGLTYGNLRVIMSRVLKKLKAIMESEYASVR